MMSRNAVAALGAALALFFTVPAFAADAAKQAEVRKAVAASLEKFYKAEPRLKSDVQAAPGYAVFTTYGVTFVFGGAGGTGMAHDNQSGKDTFMSVAQASAGIQAGIGERDILLVFKSKKALDDFIAKGWEFGGGGAVAAGAGGHSVGGGSGEAMINDAMTYALTKNGLDVGGGVAGAKFWKSKELN